MGFPNCSSSIDGKHIRINAPVHSGSMFRNYKCFFSIVLQAVVDANYRFLAIDVGVYGKESDGGIFSHSNLSRQLENGALNANQEKVLPGTDITLPHFLVGDEANPLKTYLMYPYPQYALKFLLTDLPLKLILRLSFEFGIARSPLILSFIHIKCFLCY